MKRKWLAALAGAAVCCILCATALAEGWWVDGDGLYYHAEETCALAREARREADSYATFAGDMGVFPCPACVPAAEDARAPRSWQRGGTVVVQLPDSWIEGQIEEQFTAADAPGELLIQTDGAGGDLARLIHGAEYQAVLSAAAKGDETSADAFLPESLSGDEMLLMSCRHLGGAWILVLRPDQAGRRALNRSGQIALPLRLWRVPLVVQGYDAGMLFEAAGGSRYRDVELKLKPQKASGEEVCRQSGDGYSLYVLRDGDVNTLVLRERDLGDGDSLERMGAFGRDRFSLKGYADEGDGVFICAVSDGEVEQLKQKRSFEMNAAPAVPLWRTDGGEAASPEQSGAGYVPVSAATLEDGTAIALSASEYPVGTPSIACTLSLPQGGVAYFDNVARLEYLSGGNWYRVGDANLEGVLDGDPEAARPGWFCDAMTVTWPLEDLGVLKEGLYRLAVDHDSVYLEFRVREGVPQPEAPPVRHRARDFEIGPHTPAWTDAEGYNSCTDNSRVFTGDGWRLLAGDVVYELKGVDESWGWGIHTHYSLFAWPVGQPERAVKLLDDFDHSEVSLWDLGDGLLLGDDDGNLWRCDPDGGNLRALELALDGSPEEGQSLGFEAESYRVRSLLPVGDGLLLATEGGIWRTGLDAQAPRRLYRAERGISNGFGSAMVVAGGRLLVEDGGLVAVDIEGARPAVRLTDGDEGWDGTSGFDYIALNGRVYFWSEERQATVSMPLEGGDVREVSKERFWFYSVTPSGIVLALTGSKPGLFGDAREAAHLYFPLDPEYPAFDPDHCQKQAIDPEAFDVILGDWFIHTDESGAETWTPLKELVGGASSPAQTAAPPAPAGDLSFLFGYADAVRVGDWFLACEAATEVEAPFDSATRNTTARWVLLDDSGNTLAEDLYWWPKDYDWALHPRPFEEFEEGADTAVLRVGQKYGLIDRSGAVAAEPMYDEIFGILPGDTCTPAQKDGKWGCIDAEGNAVVPFVYDSSFARFENGVTVAERGGKQLLLGEDGTELMPPQFTEMWLEDGAKYGMAHRDGNCVVFDRQGNILLEKELGGNGWIYTDAPDGLPMLCFDGRAEKYGYIDLEGNEVLPAIFDEAVDFGAQTGAALVRLDGKCGMIRPDGSYLIPAEYDDLQGFSEGLCAAEKDGLWGYLDGDGNVAIPFRFAWAGPFEGGWAEACPEGAWSSDGDYGEGPEVHGLIDRAGAWAIEPRACDGIAIGADGVAVACAYEGNACFRLTEAGWQAVVALPEAADRSVCLPHEDASGLAKLEGEKTLKKRVSEEERLPHLDGVGRLYPLYAAYVEAVYPKDVKFEPWDTRSKDPVLTQSDLDTPWQRLSDGDADIIFVPAPDREASIWATFAARGQQPVFIPLCRDAVVFAVDADNPVTDIASGDLEAVYAGRIADWSDVGGGWLGAIVPYQGGESGEAQEAFERVCAFKDLMPAPEGVTGYETWAGEATTGAASFRDLPNALGCGLYSAWAGAAPDRVKLLSVDGVAPTAENIAEGHYPFTEILYAVVLKGNDNPNVKALLDWIQSEQGRELAVKTGFAG
ncbi:MAG: WG repeat-containing protein [Clostridia bacterium]|nr:WG repeat-containing protein [Clostridia bacterium]